MAASPRPRVGIQPAPFSGNISLISITGPVTLADGTKALHATLTFNSLVPQIIAGQAVQPLVVSASTDANGDMALSLPQGLFVQITVSDRGVTYPPMNALLPLLSAIAFDQLPHLNMVTGVPEAPNYNGPFARMGTNNTWVPTVSGPSQTSGNLVYNPATNAWVATYLPATTNPADAVYQPAVGGTTMAWDSTTNQWVFVYPPAVTAPPAGFNGLAWDSNANAWIGTVWNPPNAAEGYTGQWAWNADTNWWAQVPGTGSTPLSGPISGTTNGSVAAAGQIGECVQVTGSAVAVATVTGQAFTAAAQLPLSAGDWDVSGSIRFVANATSAAPTLLCSGQLSTVAGPPNMGLVVYSKIEASFDEGGSTVLPPIQFVTAAPTSVFAIGWVNTPNPADNGLGITCTGYLHARRQR